MIPRISLETIWMYSEWIVNQIVYNNTLSRINIYGSNYKITNIYIFISGYHIKKNFICVIYKSFSIFNVKYLVYNYNFESKIYLEI